MNVDRKIRSLEDFQESLVRNFSYYVHFFSLHVSGDYVPIIRRNNCIYATLGTCYFLWMTVWYAGWNEYRDARSTEHKIPRILLGIETETSRLVA